MLERHLKNIQIYFLGLLVGIIFLVFGGSYALENNLYFTKDFVIKNINYLKYRLYTYPFNMGNLSAARLTPLDASILETPQSSMYAVAVPVLMYHGIVPEKNGHDTTARDFEKQMFLLKEKGWETLSIEDFYAFMKGEKQIPSRSFLLTFDDGRKDSFYPVDPILHSLNYNAVSFIITSRSLTTKPIHETYHLSLTEIKEMQKSGRWDIQAHGSEGHNLITIDENLNRDHFYSNRMWLVDEKRLETVEEFQKRVSSDLEKTRLDIEKALSSSVIAFAYPFGDYGQRSVNFSPEAEKYLKEKVKSEYPLSFYQNWSDTYRGNSPLPGQNSYSIRRIDVPSDIQAEELLALMENSQTKVLPFEDSFSGDKGWIGSWGTMTLDGKLTVEGSEDTTGGLAFLDGTETLRDYIFTAQIDEIKGKSFSLIARRADQHNLVSCDFSKEEIKVVERIDGKENILFRIKGNFKWDSPRSAYISVKGNLAECGLDNHAFISSSRISEKIHMGGIGIRTWDSVMGNGFIRLGGVHIREI